VGEQPFVYSIKMYNLCTSKTSNLQSSSSEYRRGIFKRLYGYSMRRFTVLLLITIVTAALFAEAPCPADVKAIPFHNVSKHQMIVEVSINHSGPYQFLLDTGTQMTVVDRSLAQDLRLVTTGNADVAGVSFRGEAMFARLDTLAVGDHVSTNQGVLVYNMKALQAAGFAIRGLLGEDFLSRFDVLIDNKHHVLCMDDTDAMRSGMEEPKLPPSNPGAPMPVLAVPAKPSPSVVGSVGILRESPDKK
jgi:predicted aspartyl protease